MEHENQNQSTQPIVYLHRIPGNEDLKLPRYMSAAASGLDLPAAIEDSRTLKPQERALLPTGFAIQLPPGFEAQVRPRSGLALEKGLTVLNSPGTIDNDYRGEIKVILINLDSRPQTVERGERIAQLVITRYTRANCIEVDELEDTERGSGGFGSTDL